MENPILIAAPGRSGTTMLAWLLHLHGVWIGKARPTQSPETNPPVGTENFEIKTFIRQGDLRKVKQFLASRVPPGRRWLIKTANLLHTREHWFREFPQAWWLCPVRPIEDIVRSRMLHPGTKGRGEATNRSVAEQQIANQRDVLNRADRALSYSAADLCKGGDAGEAVARDIFEFVDIGFDPAIYHDWVDPGRWHGEHD